MENNSRYRVWMYTRPGIGCTFYDGKVDVWASSTEDAKLKAILEADKVHRRGRDGYVVTGIQVIG